MTKHLTTALRAREGGAINSSSGIVAEIKAKLPVADIVGETVALKRAGTIRRDFAPFHAEKTPSFIVTPERDTWHCFGCGEHGDIFTFVMRRDGLDFREALSRLAERAGVGSARGRPGRTDVASVSAKRSRRRSRGIARFCSRRVRPSGLAPISRSEDSAARRQERFGIGYAPNTWEALSTRRRAKGFSDGELTDAGIASPSSRGGVYDRFRGRIIIPIRDATAGDRPRR